MAPRLQDWHRRTLYCASPPTGTHASNSDTKSPNLVYSGLLFPKGFLKYFFI